MLFWIILLVFGVPLIAFMMQTFRTTQTRESRLQEIEERLIEKRQEAIHSKVAAIKEKRKEKT